MRKEKIVVIDNKKITVSEIKTSDAIDLLSSNEGMKTLIGVTGGQASDIYTLILKCIDKTPEELEEIAEGFSAYSKIEEAFRQVNVDFLALLPARVDQMTKSMAAIIAKMPGASSTARAGSRAKATSTSGTTAGPGLKEQ